uniref:Uncharacterized protein n=1 Tax=uncultured bacterium AB_162 TaxID=1630011 RepID=A0A0E3JRL5_9BACT|nr:hypothetical protein [uncultured bacterium AB_162]
MTAVTLTRVGSTLLYQPSPPASGFVAFLLWQSADPPASIPSTDTWASEGLPRVTGWYLFIDAAAVDATFEQAVRGALTEPALTSFAWVRYASGKVEVKAAAPVVAGGPEAVAGGEPVLAGDVSIVLPPGQRGVTLVGGAPVLATGDVDAFAFTYPPAAGLPPPTPSGVSVPLSGAAAGALAFQGLVNAGDPQPGAVRKSLLFVQVDPLRPLDGTRTFQALTGRDYLLVDDQGLYRLEPA